jgi:type IV secretory pathway VirB10-like protein
MKRVSLFVLAVLMCALSLSTQAQTASDPQPSNNNLVIPEGTNARLSLQSQLSSKLNEVGDEVIGVLYEAVRSSDGRVAIPRGTEFVGRITQVQAAKRPQRQATLTVVF